MQRASSRQGSDDKANSSGLRNAFKLLSARELGKEVLWNGPESELELGLRVETLVLLFDILPRSELNQLDAVFDSWNRLAPESRAVSITQLRESARGVLKSTLDPNKDLSSGEENLRRAIDAIGLSETGNIDVPVEAAMDYDPAEAGRLCAFGLCTWFNHLSTKERWTHLPAVVPGETAIKIDEVYVELYAVSEQDITIGDDLNASAGRASSRMPGGQCPVLSVPAMVARTIDCCMVIGEPGSGKSTLVQWLAWAVHHRQCVDFDAAIVVKLSAFAAALAEQPDLSIVDFFFDSLGTQVADWRPASQHLRLAAAAHRRILLLLDGWDEVPTVMREDVRARIVEEQPHFIVVITSRPSGMPQAIRDRGRMDFYRIAGLTASASESLARNLLRADGRLDLVESILHRIRNEPDLRDMAANPLLLGLLVRVLTHDERRASPRTRADFYQQIVTWIQDQYNHSNHQALTTDHLAALRRLCHGLLFDGDLPRYLFGKQELMKSLSALPAEPVLRSRFVNRVDPIFDEYTFLHATFQEFLAAEFAGTIPAEKLDEFLNRAFKSASRLIVLEFLAGLPGKISRHCQEKALEWLGQGDRFHQILLRVVRLAAAGGWATNDRLGIGRVLREQAWLVIQQNEDMSLTKAAVDAFAAWDPVDLCRRARNANGLDHWVIACLIDAVPKLIARQERLNELLSGEWRDYAGMDVVGGATDDQLQAIRSALENRGLSGEDRREAVIHASAARDRSLVPALLEILDDPSEASDVREQAVDALGVIGGRGAVDALVDVVTGVRPVHASAMTMAVTILHHGGHKVGALDPNGRDRLIRRLAVLPPEDLYIESILAALQGYPIRDGGELIAELAGATHLRVEVRSAAVRVLATVAERNFARSAIASIESEMSSPVISELLVLAIDCSMRVPLAWLEKKIAEARDRTKRVELLVAYLLVLRHATVIERDCVGDLLHKALRNDSESTVRLAGDLHRAMLRVDRKYVTALPEASCDAARAIMNRFAELPETVPTDQVLLAATILSHSRSVDARRDVRHALDTALAREIVVTDAQEQNRVQRLADVLASTLAEIAPGDLLEYPLACAPAHSALRALTVKRGWLVYPNAIIDAEGGEVANLRPRNVAETVLSNTTDLKDLIQQLPSEGRKALYGYWLIVKTGGPCQSGDSLATIHAAMCERIKGERDDDSSEILAELFPQGPPKFGTWQKALTRVEKRFTGQPAMIDQLRRIGLCRRSDKSHS